MSDSFFLSGNDVCTEYRLIREGQSYFADTKKHIDDLWQLYRQHDLADPHHQRDAKKQLHQRYWEMYLAKQLIEHGLPLQKHNRKGPDFYTLLNGRHLHIEAKTETPGTNSDDRVPNHLQILDPDDDPETIDITFNDVPMRQIQLRLTNGLTSKAKKLSDYITEQLISSDDYCIIALNGHQITAIMDLLQNPPLIVKVLFGMGNKLITYNEQSHKLRDDNRFERQPIVTKANNQEVSTCMFLSDAYAHISGILYSNVYSTGRDFDFIYIENPLAQNPIPDVDTVLPFIKHYQVTE